MTAPTLATVATQFLHRRGLARGTLKAYESTLMPLLSMYGSWPIDLLERGEVVEYLQGLTHLAYTTRRKHQATVQALFNFAVEKGDLKANPIARLKLQNHTNFGTQFTPNFGRQMTPTSAPDS